MALARVRGSLVPYGLTIVGAVFLLYTLTSFAGGAGAKEADARAASAQSEAMTLQRDLKSARREIKQLEQLLAESKQMNAATALRKGSEDEEALQRCQTELSKVRDALQAAEAATEACKRDHAACGSSLSAARTEKQASAKETAGAAQRVAELEAQAAEAADQIEGLRKQVTRANKRNAALQAKVKELERAHAEAAAEPPAQGAQGAEMLDLTHYDAASAADEDAGDSSDVEDGDEWGSAEDWAIGVSNSSVSATSLRAIHNVSTSAGAETAASPASPSSVLPASIGTFKIYGETCQGWRACYHTGMLDLVREVFTSPAVGMREVGATTPDWQTVWALADELQTHVPGYFGTLQPYQKLNHYPNIRELGNKRLLHLNLARARSLLGPSQFSFFPLSYILPSEFPAFLAEWQRRNSTARGRRSNLWLLKRPEVDRGGGLQLVQSAQEVQNGFRNAIVQEYIADTALLNGYKYNLRIYVLITSVAPLRVYLHREGIVYLASEKYSKDPQHFNNTAMHITNANVLESNTYYHEHLDEFVWSISKLRHHLAANGVDVEAAWKRMQDLVVRTVSAAELKLSHVAQASIPYRGVVYELLGLDVMFDSEYNPYLLEVNPDPSFACSVTKTFDLTKRIKSRVLEDTLRLVGLGSRQYVAARFDEHQRLFTEMGAVRAPTDRGDVRSFLPPSMAKHSKRCTEGVPESLGLTCAFTEDELYIASESEIEYRERGGFDRVYPSTQLGHSYLSLLEAPTRHEAALMCWEHLLHRCGGLRWRTPEPGIE